MAIQKIYISTNLQADLESEIEGRNPGNIFILTDSTTKKLCLNQLGESILSKAKVIEIPAGDDHKNIESLASVWLYLTNNNATRKSLMINLGGGMVTDLGGFAASTFKRGMDYINIPTTLLGAVDAAVGGKTGINFNGLKNEIGVINSSKSVIIYAPFFKTLDHHNFLSGYAEMIKHGLISNQKIWDDILAFNLNNIDYDRLPYMIKESVEVKEEVVKIDPTEKGIRKALNFGHTIGHAFESYAMKQGNPALHGYAVAWGMIPELYLSFKKAGLSKDILREGVSLIKENYGSFFISCKDYDKLYELMTHDKKNEGDGRILFSLISGIGDVKININIEKQNIFESLDFYCDSVGI
ncbi:MAG TPA: 3-dehydroquinate synthase [Paludibacteraceae bacterium]|nr:3-dehydroquinate synthase [Paludibacteraceae bacterium]HOU69227.1 3-dehydroquinate synthase [Paludibacteraceae bacterium]HPH63877.1 3-dehydroquinate synthase [Paludibacteraceae bacterium]HQF50987.1 3-dehydroquinate synthase [Paludibacteraceae bacterium]HQJ89546.1 3-dehydroquinate synthase [Paludibacteraceae bacterium]